MLSACFRAALADRQIVQRSQSELRYYYEEHGEHCLPLGSNKRQLPARCTRHYYCDSGGTQDVADNTERVGPAVCSRNAPDPACAYRHANPSTTRLTRMTPWFDKIPSMSDDPAFTLVPNFHLTILLTYGHHGALLPGEHARIGISHANPSNHRSIEVKTG